MAIWKEELESAWNETDFDFFKSPSQGLIGESEEGNENSQ
jgi:hypothetical protein